ncbi:MAG: hypothetical protein E7256_01585 [Lachnospiraceae bacterium]|nr:hypothetical protein [Lachnospiraceae bacterium]
MKKVKQIVAIIAVVLLLSLYGLSFVSALMAKPYANGLFMASLFSTIAVPVFIYGLLVVYKMVHRNDEDMSLRELRKQNREYTKSEKNK